MNIPYSETSFRSYQNFKNKRLCWEIPGSDYPYCKAKKRDFRFGNFTALY